jgi:hypothetical protein
VVANAGDRAMAAGVNRRTPVALALIRPGQLYVWKGPSLLLVDERGDCGEREQLSGYYPRATAAVIAALAFGFGAAAVRHRVASPSSS